ncbi:MAG: S-methyl-5-thioribose-1-phosphate isomerase [Thermodesulfobacteria bacterium]|nr:S-methyl-5-thioribose-1-phosphate isomerase [Thermodesulfobacteriota bacterium]
MERRFFVEEIAPSQVDVIKAWIWTKSALFILDQRKLPHKEIYIKCDTVKKVKHAIKVLAVRGAPAIGICASIGFVLGFEQYFKSKTCQKVKSPKLLQLADRISQVLNSARPTAVNLFWATKRMKRIVSNFVKDKHTFSLAEVEKLIDTLKAEALKIWEEDIKANLRMAENGLKELRGVKKVLTHCNTGALATGGYGTALGVIRKLWETEKNFTVFVDETRPLLQGARLTAWELAKLKIPFKVIPDNSAAFVIKEKKVEAVIVGADRIARNGDTANKIGTYSLAILSKYHGIPFYIAAPSSTFDLECTDGREIPIEQRNSEEVLTCMGKRVAPKEADAINFAFDVTPAELITGFITEKGVIKPPYNKNIPKVVGNEG